ALRDVTVLAECSLICAVGFELESEAKAAEEMAAAGTDHHHHHHGPTRFGLVLSKIGKQIDYLESAGSRWCPVGHRLTSANLANRTITSGCVVGQRQLWLGDSAATIHVHDLATAPDGRFRFVCSIRIESPAERPVASLTGIKSIGWIGQS